MASDEETLEALRARLGGSVASLLAAGGPGRTVTGRTPLAERPAAATRQGRVSDERLLRALAKEIRRLMAEEGRRGA